MRTFGMAALGAALAGCAGGADYGNPAKPQPAVSFEEVQSLILAERGRLWKDAGSIRDASIGRPYVCAGGVAHMADMPNACICVEVNARNGFGGYTGLSKTEVMLNGPRVVDALPATRQMTYPCGPMTPFPELNGDYAPPAPPPVAKRRS